MLFYVHFYFLSNTLICPRRVFLFALRVPPATELPPIESKSSKPALARLGALLCTDVALAKGGPPAPLDGPVPMEGGPLVTPSGASGGPEGAAVGATPDGLIPGGGPAEGGPEEAVILLEAAGAFFFMAGGGGGAAACSCSSMGLDLSSHLLCFSS